MTTRSMTRALVPEPRIAYILSTDKKSILRLVSDEEGEVFDCVDKVAYIWAAVKEGLISDDQFKKIMAMKCWCGLAKMSDRSDMEFDIISNLSSEWVR